MKLSVLSPCAWLLLGAWPERATFADPGRLDPPPESTRNLLPAQTGSFPVHWIDGLDCASEPKMQVQAYNPDFYILRQSKCESYEAPFLYLMFGTDKALLLDTGANVQSPVWRTVDRIVQDWLSRTGKSSIPLIVAHSHSHPDHVQGDAQFMGVPYVQQVVGLALEDVVQFWGFQDYPHDIPTLDLGGRVLDVIGTPGHQQACVTLYDRETRLLLTGDVVYPGHLFIFSAQDWPDFVASARRLVDFAETHPVEWVLGCHIEMSAVAGVPYMYTTPAHPNEHALQLRPAVLAQLFEACLAMGDDPQCKVFGEFVLHPFFQCGIFWNG